MSKYTAEQFISAAANMRGLSKLSRSEMDSAAEMLAYAAHLAAQAEWPSEEDAKKAARVYAKECGVPLDGVLGPMRAALQSLRRPVGLVSDDDLLASVLTAAEDMLCFPYRGPDQDRLRSALESYASRHAPTKD